MPVATSVGAVSAIERRTPTSATGRPVANEGVATAVPTTTVAVTTAVTAMATVNGTGSPAAAAATIATDEVTLGNITVFA